MPLTQDQLDGLNKQIFMVDYLSRGLFPCQSDVIKMIRSNKREWTFNNKFEYRMLLAVTNTGGTLNSQVYRENIGLVKPGSLGFGIYHATYGHITDGFDVDMMVNLETEDKRAAFELVYATQLHSLRVNVASIFKNLAIHGKYGVVHQLRATIDAPNIDPACNPRPNTGFTPTLGSGNDAFTIKAPVNVYSSNFQRGKYLIKTQRPSAASGMTNGPWAPADGSELYMILDNQLGYLSLLPVGTSVSPWEDGDFLEVAQNREVVGMSPTFFHNWNYGAISETSGPFMGIYDQFTGTGAYTAGKDAVTGSMEGLADLFPWYTDPQSPNTRLGIEMPFRNQPDRFLFSQQQAGSWIVQQPGEHIIDCIMRGALQTKASVPYADVGIWMNEFTRQQMGYEEAGNVRVLRDNFIAGKIIYQRGIETHDYQVGNAVIKQVLEDQNLPTDVIIIGPQNQINYNCWDNVEMQIDNFIQETWGKNPPPDIDNLEIPSEMLAKMDFRDRLMIGPPSMTDGGMSTGWSLGNNIRHPKNAVNVAYVENGALFTEYPYAYTIVKLREPICDLATV